MSFVIVQTINDDAMEKHESYGSDEKEKDWGSILKKEQELLVD